MGLKYCVSEYTKYGKMVGVVRSLEGSTTTELLLGPQTKSLTSSGEDPRGVEKTEQVTNSSKLKGYKLPARVRASALSQVPRVNDEL